MNEPKIAATCPKQVQLEAGKKYAYCTCGLSEDQPFCDGRHKGTKFLPNVFTASESCEAYLCQCKRTGNEPHCDGSHQQLESDS